MRISDWSSDVCSSDLEGEKRIRPAAFGAADRRGEPAEAFQRFGPDRRGEVRGAELQEIGIVGVIADADDIMGGKGRDARHRARDFGGHAEKQVAIDDIEDGNAANGPTTLGYGSRRRFAP